MTDRPTPMLDLKHFATPWDALDYAMAEIIATLGDDLERQENGEREHYTDEDRQNMSGKIADLEQLRPYVCLRVDPFPGLDQDGGPTELTPEGEQFVIPGTERRTTDAKPQGNLW